jgi:hypothetical protein
MPESTPEPATIFKTSDGKVIHSAQDVPTAFRRLVRQRFFHRWYKIATLAPAAVLLLVIFTFYPNGGDSTSYSMIVLVVLWAVAILSTAIYLQFYLPCPACRLRFGLRDECRNCGLPRHRQSTSQ